jgi:hypothetical protein
LVPQRFGVYAELRQRREMDTNTGFDNSNIRIEAGTPSYTSPESCCHTPVTAIANMGWCGRAAYDISFFGVNGFPENNMGEIGTAIHKRMDHSQEGYQLSAGVGEWYIILYSLLT